MIILVKCLKWPLNGSLCMCDLGLCVEDQEEEDLWKK